MPRACRNPECPGADPAHAWAIPDSADPRQVDCSHCLAKMRRWLKVGLGKAFKWHRRLSLSDSIVKAILPDEKLKVDANPEELEAYQSEARAMFTSRSRRRAFFKRPKQPNAARA